MFRRFAATPPIAFGLRRVWITPPAIRPTSLFRRRTGLDTVRLQRTAQHSGNHLSGRVLRRSIRARRSSRAVSVQTLSQGQDVKFGRSIWAHDAELKPNREARVLGLAAQLGEGEYEGADSDRPEWEARSALSFQVDHAQGSCPGTNRSEWILWYAPVEYSVYVVCGVFADVLLCGDHGCVLHGLPDRLYRFQPSVWRANHAAGANPMVHPGGERVSRW